MKWQLLNCVDDLRPSQQFLSQVRTGLPVLNQHLAGDKVSCSRRQHNDSMCGEA